MDASVLKCRFETEFEGVFYHGVEIIWFGGKREGEGIGIGEGW